MTLAGFNMLPIIRPMFDLHSRTFKLARHALLIPRKFQILGGAAAGAGVATTAGPAVPAAAGAGPAGICAHITDVIITDVIPTRAATLRLILLIFMAFSFGSPVLAPDYLFTTLRLI